MMRAATQREIMRHLYQELGGDEGRVVAAYAAAERRGEVARRSNQHGIDAEGYARRLFADGMAKGWISAR